jgi:hypothetical protein
MNKIHSLTVFSAEALGQMSEDNASRACGGRVNYVDGGMPLTILMVAWRAWPGSFTP